MNQKFFKAKEMHIDPPVTYEFGNASDARTDLGDEQPVGDEDVIIDSRKLYKNFMSFVENHQWKPISQTVNKRGDANLKDD